jgi:hypothetical protein
MSLLRTICAALTVMLTGCANAEVAYDHETGMVWLAAKHTF